MSETDHVALAVGTGKGGGVDYEVRQITLFLQLVQARGRGEGDYKVRQIMLLLQLVQAKQGSVNYEVRQTVSLLLQLAQVGCGGGGERRT